MQTNRLKLFKMEFCFLTTTIFELKDAKDALLVRKPFLNFDAAEFPILHFLMMTLKCLIAGYGMRKIVPRLLTVTVALLYLLCELIWFIDFCAVAHLLLNGVAMYISNIESMHFIFNALMWQISSVNFGYKIFLDIYVIVTVLCYIFQLFADEYEKACALACYFYCLNYWTDYVVGEGSVGIFHATVVIYLPALVLTSFSPLSRKRTLDFFFITVLTLVCLSLKLMKALLVNGKQNNVWNVAQLDLGSVFDLMSLNNTRNST